MAKVVSSRLSGRPSCILHRVSPEDCRAEGDTQPINRGKIQLGRAYVREDTTLAMILKVNSQNLGL